MTDNRYYFALEDQTTGEFVGEPVAADNIQEAWVILNRISLKLPREQAINPDHKYRVLRKSRAIYAWMITRDHLWEDSHLDPNSADPDEMSDIGRMGPRDMSPEHEEMLNLYLAQLQNNVTPKRLEGQKTFKMWDDDGILYYTGIAIGELECDEPLRDFGTPNAGAVKIGWPRHPEMDCS